MSLQDEKNTIWCFYEGRGQMFVCMAGPTGNLSQIKAVLHPDQRNKTGDLTRFYPLSLIPEHVFL